ncbi:hypothetical protein [Paucibacter sp. Y2R2-4]|uniref:hypothetical protein n=1 Tax=Paucibacter sp. Y2R2-4 TaxID=2893553 RepID=UPI0021E3B3BB|nr:hypothetical protein [Paucibacter sp. Y2R2-4]MCV2350715.1 hypothetical protein [Paucibacter sp. Y2R2-4]
MDATDKTPTCALPATGQTRSTTLRTHALGLSLLGSLMLSACGGGGLQDQINDFVDSAGCAISNCKQSDTLRIEDIRPEYKVTQEGSQVRIESRLGFGDNPFSVVYRSGSDRLSAGIGALRVDMTDDTGKGITYVGKLADATEQPSVFVNFHRGGEVYTSSITMQKPFSVVSPSGVPVIARSTGAFKVQMSQPASSGMGVLVSALCKRADGTSFDSNDLFLGNTIDGNSYRISTLDLDLALNNASKNYNPNSPNSSLVQSCDLTFNWTHRITGTTASGMNRSGWIQSLRSATHKASYDARL